MKIKINPDYEKLVHPLTKLEYNSLKESIKNNDGLWHPITVNWDGIILDGHHRYRACQELGIKPTIELKNSSNSLEEKLFVINSNRLRRQLNDFQEAELAYYIEDELRQAAGSNEPNGKPKGRTAIIVSNETGLSAATYKRARKIILEGSESVKQKLRAGKSTIFREYRRVQNTIEIKKIRNELLMANSCSNDSSYSNSNPNYSYSHGISNSNNNSNDSCNLMLGDMMELGKTIARESIDLIFTDPPYAEKYLYLYQELLNQSERTLKQGGSLVMYAPSQLDKIFAMIANAELKYADIIAVHQNGSTAKLWKNGIWADCKFLIWCYKGKVKPTKFHDLSNFIESEPVGKHNHDWEQSTIEVMHMIKPLTLEGMTVLDPFMGSGTTGLSSIKLNRKFIGIEISPLHYSIAQTRLSAVMATKL